MADWYCPKCNASVPDDTVIRRAEGRARMLVYRCPSCQGLVEKNRPRPVGSHAHALVGSLRYPLTPLAVAHLGGLGVLAALLAHVFIIGPLIAGGLQVAYLAQTVRLGTLGRDELPEIDIEGGLAHFVQLLAQQTLAISVPFLPLLIYQNVAAGEGYAIGRVALTALALCYLPASILCVAHGGSALSAFNLVGGVQLIARIPGAYALTAISLALVAGTHIAWMALVRTVVSVLGFLPLIPAALEDALGLIFPVIGARMVGLLVFHHQTELGLED